MNDESPGFIQALREFARDDAEAGGMRFKTLLVLAVVCSLIAIGLLILGY